ncbi:MAG: TetR/AcrR family transcriptional regulator [Micrococcaceae bacterium]|nr:TetR/AcrR family transcriptional regulator [Micrococcaceae bacterium]
MVRRNENIELEDLSISADRPLPAPDANNYEFERTSLLQIAAARLGKEPFPSVTIANIASDANVPEKIVRSHFLDMHEVGSAVLDHERSSMRNVQQRVSKMRINPLDQLAAAFQIVGENLSKDIVVRAGVRIAAESRDYFPERRLDPFKTWEDFVNSQLSRACDLGLIRVDVELSEITWIIVAAGIGSKEFFTISNTWHTAPDRLESTLRNIIALISPSEAGMPGAVRENR